MSAKEASRAGGGDSSGNRLFFPWLFQSNNARMVMCCIFKQDYLNDK